MLKDRNDAAHRLAQRLEHWKGRRPLILIIPRGAAPMGEVLARELGGDLDVVLVRKLGAPGNPEYALGALDESGTVHITDPDEWARLAPSVREALIQRELDILRVRRQRYTPLRPPLDPRGRVVIVVDDGIATGATVTAALAALRRHAPERLVLAVGVAPPASLERLMPLADEIVCLEKPDLFWAVGQYYETFEQVEDAEVEAILRRDAHRRGEMEGLK
ncbi:MAG: phosphoribosyltransferase [Pseudomonadota bacterium]